MTRAIIRRFFQTNAKYDRQRNGRRKQTPNMNTGRALFSFSLSLSLFLSLIIDDCQVRVVVVVVLI